MEQKDLSEIISGHFLQYMYQNNPSEGKKNFFFWKAAIFFLPMLLSDIRLFYEFLLSSCPPPGILLHPLPACYIQLQSQFTKKFLKSKESRTVRSFVQGYTHTTYGRVNHTAHSRFVIKTQTTSHLQRIPDIQDTLLAAKSLQLEDIKQGQTGEQ